MIISFWHSIIIGSIVLSVQLQLQLPTTSVFVSAVTTTESVGYYTPGRRNPSAAFRIPNTSTSRCISCFQNQYSSSSLCGKTKQQSDYFLTSTTMNSYQTRKRRCRSSRVQMSTSSSEKDDNNNNNRERKQRKWLFPTLRNQFKNSIKRIVQTPKQSTIIIKIQEQIRILKTRYRSLTKVSQRVVIMQIAIVMLLLTSTINRIASSTTTTTTTFLGTSIVSSRRRLSPIEIPYSNFLDIVEQQSKITKGTSSDSVVQRPEGISLSSVSTMKNVPVISNLRIGNDRYVYRLYPNPNIIQQQQQRQSDLLSESTTTTAKTEQKTVIQQPPFIPAYTRPLPTTAVSSGLLSVLRDNDITFSALPAPKASLLQVTVRTVAMVFYFLVLWRLYRTISGGGSGIGGGGGGSGNGRFGNSNDVPGKLANGKNGATVTDAIRQPNGSIANFDDIQGIDNAKVEVMELVDALRYPEKYSILGARAPTGLLLEGPPGTGKTMLARATAATAGVPLLYCSGSDFVEMFVGRGAARVRKLFEKAEKLAPCIIFVDELDALGKSRDMGLGPFGGGGGGSFRSNDEAEQTLNQLLACMDGLDSTRRICVLAATNRKEVLDPALIRPGRFDRIVTLKLPDVYGRERILRVHTQKLPGFKECSGVDPKRIGSLGIGQAVDLSAVASMTDGFSGAELEFLVNEAAIRAVRRVSSALQRNIPTNDITPHVSSYDFEDSIRNFYETRKPKQNNLFKNVFK